MSAASEGPSSSPPMSIPALRAEAWQARQDQIRKEEMKAAFVFSVGFVILAAFAYEASQVTIRTYSDFTEVLNLLAYGMLLFVLAFAIWMAWYRRPSPRLRLIVKLADLSLAMREIQHAQGGVHVRQSMRRELGRLVNDAYMNIPAKNAYTRDFFLARHRSLFDELNKALLGLQARIKKKAYDEFASKGIKAAADALDAVIRQLDQHQEGISDEMITAATRLTTTVGVAPPSVTERLGNRLRAISPEQVGRVAFYVGLAFGITFMIWYPLYLISGVSGASLVGPVVGPTISLAILFLQRPRKDYAPPASGNQKQ